MKTKIISYLFVCIIAIPFLIGMSVHGLYGDFFLGTENRNATKLTIPPKITVQMLKKFRDNIKLVINDRLIKRDKIVILTNKALLNPVLYYSTDMSKAIIGKNGFVFLGNNYENVINRHYRNFVNSNEYNEKQLQRHTNLRSAAKSVNADYFILVSPDKHGVYCREFPDWVKTEQCSRVNKITNERIEFLSKNGFIIDYPFDKLYNKSKQERVYYKTDTHWNELGAEIGFYSLLDIIKNKSSIFQNNKFVKSDDYYMHKEKNTNFGDLGKIASLPDFFPLDDVVYKFKTNSEYKIKWRGKDKTDFEYLDIQNVKSRHDAPYEHMINENAPNKMKVFIIHDSFNTAMTSFWNIHFSEIIYSNRGKNEADLIKTIKEFKPDFVIYETVERAF